MAKEIDLSFAARYQETLQQYLESRGRAVWKIDSLLGLDTAQSEINLLDLVRIHNKSISAIALHSELVAESDPDSLNSLMSLPSAFLIEVLKLLEAKQPDNVQVSRDAHQSCKDQLAEITYLYKQLLTESKKLKLESQKQAHQVLIAHEEERKEISRELHDELAQILAGINLRLALIKETSSINHQNIIENILKAQKMVEESVDMVHRFAFRLRPAILDDLGLIPALRSYIKELQGHKGLDIRFSVSKEAETLDSMRRTALYRIVQEALLNVVRHAEAQLATVKIEKVQDQIRLEIHDNGKSFQVDSFLQPRSHEHLGLLGMRERLEMIGGKLSIESEAGKGTTVRAEIPFQSTED